MAQLQDVHSALLANKGLAHVEEALRVEKLTLRNIELSQLSAVVEQVTQNFAVGLLIEKQPQYSDLPDLQTELESFDHASEVGYRVLKFDFLDDKRFDELLLTKERFE